MGRLVSIVTSIAFLVSQTAFATTAPLDERFMQNERELEWFEDALVALVASDDSLVEFEKMESTLNLLFPNPSRQAAIQAERAKTEARLSDDRNDLIHSKGPFDNHLIRSSFRSYLMETLMADYARLRQEQMRLIESEMQADPAATKEKLKVIALRMGKLMQYEAEHPLETSDYVKITTAIVLATAGAISMIPGLVGMFISLPIIASVVAMPVGFFLMMISFVAVLPGAAVTMFSGIWFHSLLKHRRFWNWKLDALLEKYQAIGEKAKTLAPEAVYQSVL